MRDFIEPPGNEHDGVAYPRLQGGSSICLPPNNETVFTNACSVTGVRISSSSTR
ncbi:hypothetical protein ACN6K4_000110 [Streptomyces hayashii]|uniref:hypothetical protein n=1 Tax=Streptomyces TaxID=1883 RepID=UPI002FF3589F